MTRFSLITISFLLSCSVLWAQSETAKPSPETSAPAPSSSATIPGGLRSPLNTKTCSDQTPQPCLTPPRPTHSPKPEYSKEARKKLIAGIVVLYLEVGTDGRPRNIKVVRSLGYGLDEEAIKAAEKWEFAPGTYNAIPVATAVNIEVTFHPYPKEWETSKPGPETSAPAPSSSTGMPPDSTKVELINGVHAVYPEAAREKELQGQVWLKVHISETGDVEGVDVLSGDPILAEAAVDAVKKWKFKPYIKDGRPAKVLYKMPMDFAFNGKVTDIQTPPAGAGTSSNANPLQISAGVSQGLLIHKVEPVYPMNARQLGIEGAVVLHAFIDETGRISNLEPISGPKELIAPAIAAVLQWRYRPYLMEGKPTEVETQITVIFRLK